MSAAQAGGACPHRSGTKAAMRWAERQIKAEHRARLHAIRQHAVERVAAGLPKDWQSWGVVRTQAWLRQKHRLAQMVKHGPLRDLGDAIHTLNEVERDSTPVERLASIASDAEVRP